MKAKHEPVKKPAKEPALSSTLLTEIIKIQSRLTAAEFNLTGFMRLVAKEMHSLTPATGAVVELVEGDEMVYRAATGTVAEYIGLRLPIKNSLSGLCVVRNEVLRCDDSETDSRVNVEACRKISARSMVVAPLVYQGHTVGVLKILSKEPHAFGEADVQTLQLMAGFIGSGLAHQLSVDTNNKLITEQKEAISELQTTQDHLYYLAHYDFLTQLANRKTFNETLSTNLVTAKNNASLMGLMYLDIDHFKHINDSLGHDIGDTLLKAFAGRLKQCVRKNDLVARLGGDEFIILLSKIESPQNAVAIAEKIIARMNEKFKLKDQVLQVTTSIGVSFYAGENTSAQELIKQADKALYSAKQGGRNTFRIFPDKSINDLS